MLYRFVKYGDSRVGTFSGNSDYSFFKVYDKDETHLDGIAIASYITHKTMREAASRAYNEYAHQHRGEVCTIIYRRISLINVIALSTLQQEAANRHWLVEYNPYNLDIHVKFGREYF